MTDHLYPDFNPDDFDSLLDSVVTLVRRTRSQGRNALETFRDRIWAQTNRRDRPMYAVVRGPALPGDIQKFMDLGVYNLPISGENEELPQSVNLWGDEMLGIRDGILDFLKTGDCVGITPFVSESKSIKRVAEYMITRLGKNKAVAGDHQRSPETGSIATATGIEIAKFGDNMRKIDWQKLVSDGIIPSEVLDENGSPIGLKGLNTYNIMVTLMEKWRNGEISDDTWILWTDADIMNIGESGEYPRELWYDPFLYMGLVIADSERRNLGLTSVMLAKTGPGRNNEVTHFMFDDMGNSADSRISKLGISLAPIIWPHTESRGYKYGFLRKCIWAKDMQIEQALDLASADNDVRQGRRLTAQVIDPVPKIECEASPDERERAMMNNLARGIKDAKTMLKQSLTSPLTMTLQDIGIYNGRMSLNYRWNTVTNNRFHTTRDPQLVLSDVMLPSFEMMQNGGYLFTN
jgi:hypothetical protein